MRKLLRPIRKFFYRFKKNYKLVRITFTVKDFNHDQLMALVHDSKLSTTKELMENALTLWQFALEGKKKGLDIGVWNWDTRTLDILKLQALEACGPEEKTGNENDDGNEDGDDEERGF